jgi:polyvinyl alcohol dehydrogenase (cytochrome)
MLRIIIGFFAAAVCSAFVVAAQSPSPDKSASGRTQIAAPLAAATCDVESGVAFDGGSPKWNGWSPSVTNSRFQNEDAAGLAASSVPKLKLKWAFSLGEVTVARSQPAIVAGRVFIGTQRGTMYALDYRTGCTRWRFQADAAVRSGVTYGAADGEPAVFFGDTKANMYALSARTGRLIWEMKGELNALQWPTATPRFYEGLIYQPFASPEEAFAANPHYPCCRFRGKITAFDANTGKKVWEAFTISETAAPTRENAAGVQQYGPSGAGVWSSPTIDEQSGALYVATGDNYSDPPTKTSDAILAFDLKTGRLLWSKQLTEGDAYNNGCVTPQRVNCPQEPGPDFDFGQPPILVDLGGHKRELIIAQKSGLAYAVDPDQSGKVLWQARVGEGGKLGGSQWGSASDGQNAYVAISDLQARAIPDAQSPRGYRLILNPSAGGGLFALDLKSGNIVWSVKPDPCAASRTDCSPAQSAAVTAIPGVVFSGSVDGHLRAYSTASGKVLWDIDTAHAYQTVNGGIAARGGSLDAAGPAVANGMVVVNSGYGQWGGMPGNVLLAFSVNGE